MATVSMNQIESEFLDVCKTKDCQAVRELILKGCDPVVRNEQGQNGLHLASQHGNIDVARLLVEVYACNPGIRDYKGRNALHLACLGGHLTIAAYFIRECKFSFSEQCNFKNTALHYACLSGDIPTVRFVMHVMSTGFYLDNLNLYQDMVSTYCNVVNPEYGRQNTSSLVIQNEDRDTAMHVAFRAGHLSVLRCFVEELELDEPLYNVLKSVLHRACTYSYGREEMFAYLIDNNMINSRSPSNPVLEESRPEMRSLYDPYKQYKSPPVFTPNFRAEMINYSVICACQNGDDEKLKDQIERYKKDPVVPINMNGDTLLHSACITNNVSLIKYLLDCQCDPKGQNKEGNTPLHVACKWGNISTVQTLIDAEISIVNTANGEGNIVNRANKEGNTPLHIALKNGRAQIAKLLLGIASCKIETLNRFNESPLHIVARSMDIELIECVVTRSTSILNHADGFGDTALFSACRSGNIDIVKLLVNAGCDPLHVNIRTCEMPIHIACRTENMGLFQYLKTKIDDKDRPWCQVNCLGQTPFHLACRRGNLLIVKEIIKHNACDCNAKDAKGMTPLHVACLKNTMEIANVLLAHLKVDVNIHNMYGDTPLHIACLNENPDIATLLIDHDACVIAKNTEGISPLHVVCLKNTIEIAKVLLTHPKVNVNIQDVFLDTPLHIACANDNPDIVTLLMHRDACVITQNKSGDTPVHIASRCCRFEIMRKLLPVEKSQGVKCNEVNKDGYTPLHISCINGRMPIVEYLTKNGHCDPSRSISAQLQNHQQHTPLHLACENGHTDVAVYLAQCVPKTLTACGRYNEYPLLLALKNKHYELVKRIIPEFCDPTTLQYFFFCCCEYGDADFLHYLVSNSICDPKSVGPQGKSSVLYYLLVCTRTKQTEADSKLLYLLDLCSSQINCPDDNGDTPLLYACNYGMVGIIPKLLEYKANPNCKNSRGDYPLHIACSHYMLSTVKVLIDYEADLSCKDSNDQTPLHIACSKPPHSCELAKLLLEKGADTSCLDLKGYSPVHTAVRRHDGIEYLKLLFQYKADPSCPGPNGDTPLHIACKNILKDVVSLLLTYNADTSCTDASGNTPLHIACMCSHVRLMDEIISMLLHNNASTKCVNATGDTPLHLACRMESNHAINELITFGADITCKNSRGQTPIQATQSFDIIKILIDHGANPQDVYTEYGRILEKCKKEQPLHELVKVFVVGKALAGKTTLVEALKSEGVDPINLDVELERTVGIVTTKFTSNDFGHVAFHDFAGQQEFYSSHSQFLESNFTSSAIVLIVVDITLDENKLAQNIHYWMNFIKQLCCKNTRLPRMISIGSHQDQVTDSKTLERVMKEATENYQCLGPVLLDCRDPTSDGLRKLKIVLKNQCNIIRDNIKIDGQCHVLCAFMHSQFNSMNFVQLSGLQRAIQKSRTSVHSNDPGSLLPQAHDTLLNLLVKLDKVGNIILLKSESTTKDEYWIILKQDIVYQKIDGNLFSPSVRVKDPSLIGNTGVLPLSVVQKILSSQDIGFDLDVTMLYLVHKEFCHRVKDPETLQLISNEVSKPTEEDIKLYFFPYFVKVEKPPTVWKSKDSMLYCSGWCLQSFDNQFFTTRFLHVLLLRLTFKYAVAQGGTSSKFRRRCNIWKNGIQWQTTQGVEVLVELTHNLTFLLILVRSLTDTRDQKEKELMECVKLRASVIRTVLDVVQQTSPGLEITEYLIDRGSLSEYPHCDLMSSPKIEVHEVVETIRKGHPRVYDTDGEAITLEELLFFEPYSSIGERLLLLICDDHEKCNKEIPSNIVLKISECFHGLRKDRLQHMLNVSKVERGDLEAESSVQYNPQLLGHHIIEKWKVSTQNGSYSELRKAFDQYSIFNGRNPLSLGIDREEPMTM